MFAAALALLLAAPAAAQTRDDVHREERARFGFGELRPGADGNDSKAPNADNKDESRVGDLAPPPLFASPGDATPAGWPTRRAELVRLVEDSWTGRIPEAAAALRVVWTRQPGVPRMGAVVEHWLGQIIAPDGRSGPTIDAIVTLPPAKRHVPALIDYTYIWPPGFRFRFPGPPPPDPVAVTLARGWAHVAFRPTLLQADDAGQMRAGVIGQARWPRERHDWGALRAWGWGASKLREALAADLRIDGNRISLAGHSRFGKAVLVAAAFDHQFADALVSSSGAGGAKLMRRDYGERWGNMAGSYAFHWYTPNVMQYAGNQPLSELPVDAHMLMALRAPRPLFVSAGLTEMGDGWTDPRGQWLATRLAQPAWAIYGKAVPGGDAQPAVLTGETGFTLSWYQHDQGHVMWPAMGAFFDHADRFAKD